MAAYLPYLTASPHLNVILNSIPSFPPCQGERSRYGLDGGRSGRAEQPCRRGLKSFQVRAEKSLRVCRAVVTRVQSSRYAYAKQSLRACEAVVTRMRSSRYARPEQPHCASGHEFYAYIWKIFSAPPIKIFSRWRFYDKKPSPPRCIFSS